MKRFEGVRCLKKKDKKAHYSHDVIGLIKEKATIEVGKQQMSLQVKTSGEIL